jgi:hypothetical protein
VEPTCPFIIFKKGSRLGAGHNQEKNSTCHSD